jgi:dUTP pyrophosphatase
MSTIDTGNYIAANFNTITLGTTIKCLVSPGARLPERAHPSDAGADLFAWFEDGTYETVIEPQNQKMIDTGIAIKIPYSFAGFVYNRSSQGKKGIQIPHGVGIIDSDYRGTIKVILKNLGTEPYKIMVGDRIAQLVIQKIELFAFQDIWNDTQRGTGGFGSTGT